MQAVFCSARQHSTVPALRRAVGVPQYKQNCLQQLTPLSIAGQSRSTCAAHSMAQQEQALAVSQPSGTVEQTETTVEIPLSFNPPTSKGMKSRKKAAPADTTASDASMAAAFSESLADRIKAGSGRRRTTQSKAHVPSAAVTALADAVDRALAPEDGTTERYMDSRDADHNVPSDIPGASAEQQQHAQQNGSSSSAQTANGQAAIQAAPDIQQNGVVKAKKSRKQNKGRNDDNSAALEAASQLAKGSSAVTDVLEEDDQVCPVYGK